MPRLHGAYDRRLLGHGPEEYKVIATASFRLFAVLTISYVPVVGDESEAAEIAGRMGVNTVACTSSWRLGTSGLRHLG